MTLDQEDLEQIQRIASQAAAESQEMLAGMIARQFLTIRQQFEEIQQQVEQVQKATEANLVDLKLDLGFIKKRLEEAEDQMTEGQKSTEGFAEELQRIRARIEQIHGEAQRDLEERLGIFEHRIQKLELTIA